MKRILIIALISIIAMTNAMAQSMSDSKVIEFVQKEQKKGTSQAQIVTKLMQKGVSVTRLQQLRKKYSKMQNGSLGASSTPTEGADNRSRTANGTSKRGGKSVEGKSTLGGEEFYPELSRRMDGGDDDEYSMDDGVDALNDFMPDSLTILEKKLEKKLKSRRKVFGRDIFNNKDLSFEPNMNIATPQNYVLGPGDAVIVDVYGASQKSETYTVSPDGEIVIEGFGPIQLSGLSVAQANRKLRSTLGSRYASSKVKLTVGQTKTIMVNVMGEVKAPGTYTLSAFASVFHALYMAGGTNELGTLRGIKVYRNGRLVSNVDIYDYILNGKLTGNVRLHDNDVIVVGPYECLVNISGKVKRPMWYEMKSTESMKSLLKYAGGFTGDAYTKSVRDIRKNGKEYSVYNVTEFDFASFKVADEDSVTVDSILPRYSNMVELKGAAFRPGKYQLGGEVTSVRSLITIADGLREDAFTQHAVMHRMKKDRTLEVIPVDIQGIMDGTVADIPLCNEDVLFIPSQKELTGERKLKIYGEVYYPGTYQYADGMTVEDFILQAGGLKNSASTTVKVNRRMADSSASSTGNVRTESYEMQLVDGFVLDGKEGFKLQPFDEVYVTRNAAYVEQMSVSIEGEVMSAGHYGMTKANTRVSDVLKLCGGITAQAAPNGVYIMRKLNEEEKRIRLKKLDEQRAYRAYAGNGSQQLSDGGSKYLFADSLLIEQFLRQDEYKVAVDLQASINEPGSAGDIILRDGDRIIVQETNNTVRVTGAVPYENTVPFVKGKGIKYYMAQGGARGAKNRRWAYIVYQNGSAKMVRDGAKVEPGCEIVLPERNTQSTAAQNASMWVSIGSTLATMGAVIVSVLK
ncbi:capsule biosynthesis protein [Palleniella muris]|uniref:Capsule biosynthesis protein n=1 Tax=Palleniella muris TaxID=3038145 RepID=A0AC61QS72_9BACT|nr:SLBB domain-containing protein [Palleniella muris]TGX83190.1 capsule biosynthesis protein [Palleniella muris]